MTEQSSGQEEQGVAQAAAQGFIQGAQQGVNQKARKKLRAPTAAEISMGGRVIREASSGAAIGAQMGRKLPKVGAGLGAVGGAVVGAGRGVVNEADRLVAQRKATVHENTSSQAGLASMRQGGGVSSPAPGEPGSRFNPIVREREDRTVRANPAHEPAAPADTAGPLIDSVPGMPPRTGQKSKIDVQGLLRDVPGAVPAGGVVAGARGGVTNETDRGVSSRQAPVPHYSPSIPIRGQQQDAGVEYEG